mgnify:FL=1|jgi:hypothetical protein
MDLVNRFFIVLAVLILMYLSATVGSASKEYEILDLYCESLSGQHEWIDDMTTVLLTSSCIKSSG